MKTGCWTASRRFQLLKKFGDTTMGVGEKGSVTSNGGTSLSRV